MKTKKRIANYLKLGILLFSISVLLWNCEREEDFIGSDEVSTNKNFKSRIVSKKDIPEIITFIQGKFLYSKKNKNNLLNLDLDKIKEVIDSANNKSYSINLKDNTPKDFSNIILFKDKEGSVSEPIVYRYLSSNSFYNNYVNGTKGIDEFSGELQVYSLANFLRIKNTYSRTDGGLPCATFPITDGNPDTNDGNQTSTGSTSYTCNVKVELRGFCSCNNDLGGKCNGPNGNHKYPYSFYTVHCKLNYSTRTGIESPCNYVTSNPDLTPVATNEPPIIPCEQENCEETYISNVLNSLSNLSEDQIKWVANLYNIRTVYKISKFLDTNNNSTQAKTFAKEAIKALMDGDYSSFDEVINNKTDLVSNETGDLDNNLVGGEDMTQYADFNPQQQTWPTISPVISKEDFVGWRTEYTSSGRKLGCMDFAKEQILKKGYQISNYHSNQTIQIYTEQNGADNNKLKKGLSYLKYALEKGIPVIVGVEAYSNSVKQSPNPNTDNTTDHFVVIVGMGKDSNGKYFLFYDNASGRKPYENYGASSKNKFYYNSLTGVLEGGSQTPYSIGFNGYIVTMIRKSKKI